MLNPVDLSFESQGKAYISALPLNYHKSSILEYRRDLEALREKIMEYVVLRLYLVVGALILRSNN